MFVIKHYEEVLRFVESEDEAKNIIEVLMRPDMYGHQKCTNEFIYEKWTMVDILNYIVSGLVYLDDRLKSHNL